MTEANHELSIKSEIEVLEKQLKEKKLELEKGSVQKIETEITRENIKEAETSNVQSQQTITTYASDADEIRKIEADINKIKDLDVSRQVNVLTTIAFDKGIYYCIKVARKLNNAYLLDELHDKLVGQLHDELVKRGKLKEI